MRAPLASAADGTAITRYPNFLRAVLAIDAATGVATGGLLTLAASPLAELLHLPRGLLFSAGLSLFPIAAFMAFIAAQPRPPAAGVWVIILGNIGWVVGSFALLAFGGLAPSVLGQAFIVVQAVAVLALATLEYVGLARLPPVR